MGAVKAHFPNRGVEKELAQAVSRAVTEGLTDSQATHVVLTEPANRHLSRQMCWVLTIDNTDAYLLVPRDSAQVDLLVETVRPSPRPGDVEVVIGGLPLPEVRFEQIYSFDTQSSTSRCATPRSTHWPPRSSGRTPP